MCGTYFPMIYNNRHAKSRIEKGGDVRMKKIIQKDAWFLKGRYFGIQWKLNTAEGCEQHGMHG